MKAKLKNEGTRAYGLPARVRDGASVPVQLIQPGTSIDVPLWYLDEMRAEPGLAAILDKPKGLRVLHAPTREAPKKISESAPESDPEVSTSESAPESDPEVSTSESAPESDPEVSTSESDSEVVPEDTPSKRRTRK